MNIMNHGMAHGYLIKIIPVPLLLQAQLHEGHSFGSLGSHPQTWQNQKKPRDFLFLTTHFCEKKVASSHNMKGVLGTLGPGTSKLHHGPSKISWASLQIALWKRGSQVPDQRITWNLTWNHRQRSLRMTAWCPDVRASLEQCCLMFWNEQHWIWLSSQCFYLILMYIVPILPRRVRNSCRKRGWVDIIWGWFKSIGTVQMDRLRPSQRCQPSLPEAHIFKNPSWTFNTLRHTSNKS